MLKFRFINIVIFVLFVSVLNLSAKENVDGNGKTRPAKGLEKSLASDCQPASAQTELNVNNVRCMLMTGGDLWWDLNDAKYEVPKVDKGADEVSRHSIFAGALWIGGIDALGQLKVAAQTYRQTGNDFWPGPLTDDGQTTSETCVEYDRFWEVRSSEINQFRGDFAIALASGASEIPFDQIPSSIVEWPGKDNVYADIELPEAKDMAPFYDYDGDGSYDPTKGDYPVVDSNVEGVYADQMIWWIFNDKGNDHTETGGEAIGLEISALAFAFATNDEVNDMTFYKYSVDNKSTSAVDSVFFGQWVDPDLGRFDDDFVGCVIDKALGICYNGDAVDEGALGYGENPPMVGVDFFQGPKDQNGVELGMSAFIYYNNDFTVQGNPETASDFYGYLAGVWKDRTPFTFGGDGYGGGEPTSYMFPTDPTVPVGEGVWSECSEGNPPADRRFLQVSGAFRLQPGAVNEVIVGVVWVRGSNDYPCPSFQSIIDADEKAQALFDSNFKLKDGPDAPDMAIRELDNELILSIWNASGNNFQEEYEEVDAVLAAAGIADSTYKFQGYRIYQLSSSTISPSEYTDADLAREIFTVDVKDGVSRIINYYRDNDLGSYNAVEEVNGADEGIRHTFRVTEDQFATGDKTLVNHRKYYFSVIAYGYNNWNTFDALNPLENGQQLPYLSGRNNIRVYTAIPHISSPEQGGTTLNAVFGDGPEITQISGEGNGGISLDLTEETVNQILSSTNHKVENPVYQGAAGPIDVRIYDPLKVPNADFELKLGNTIYKSITGPFNGDITVEEGGCMTYTPDDGFVGVDYVLYELEDKRGDSDIGVITFEIDKNFAFFTKNDAYPDSRCVPMNASVPQTIPVLNNDASVVGQVLSITSVSSDNAEVGISGTQFINYKPNANFSGLDEVKYTISADFGGSSESTVYVYVRATGDEPCVEDDLVELGAGESINFCPLDNDELEGGTLTGSSINNTVISKYARWTLTNLTSGEVYQSDQNIRVPNEQGIGGWREDIALGYEKGRPLGFTVNISQVGSPAHVLDPERPQYGMIESSIEFENVQEQWLFSMNDADGQNYVNWIRSGNFDDEDFSTAFSDYPHDTLEVYEDILDGGIAPYCLAVNHPGFVTDPNGNAVTLPISPACSDCSAVPLNTLGDLQSIDLVITTNPDLWTKCVVVEMSREPNIAVGGAAKNGMRKSTSLNKDGSKVTSGETGRSWFPGYAINVETGERLNIMFGENSFFVSDNGADMLWNPSANVFSDANDFKLGGEHYIYVMNSIYDEGQRYHDLLSTEVLDDKRTVYNEGMWVGTPLLEDGFSYRSPAEGLVPSGVTMRLRVNRCYQETTLDEEPTYRFSTKNYAPIANDSEVGTTALDLVRVVPNPYYAFSKYETSKFDNRVKITNLPTRATVRIFTLDGTLIRQLEIDNTGLTDGSSLSDKFGTTENALDWDLKNHKNIPVASGMYIIHIEAPDLGEDRTVKWFGVMRPLDLDTF